MSLNMKELSETVSGNSAVQKKALDVSSKFKDLSKKRKTNVNNFNLKNRLKMLKMTYLKR
jgi:hypothetical protein